MSLDLSVLIKERLTKERLASLHAFLTKQKFVKQRLGSTSFFYFSTKPNISIDIYLTKAPMKGVISGRTCIRMPRAFISLPNQRSRWNRAAQKPLT